MISHTYKQLKHIRLILPVLLTLFVFSGCGGGGDDSSEPTDPLEKRASLISTTKLKSFNNEDLLFSGSDLDDINQQDYL